LHFSLEFAVSFIVANFVLSLTPDVRVNATQKFKCKPSNHHQEFVQFSQYLTTVLLNLLRFRSPCHLLLHSHLPYSECMADVTIISTSSVHC